MKLTYIELEADAEEIARSRSIAENITNVLNKAFSNLSPYKFNEPLFDDEEQEVE